MLVEDARFAVVDVETTGLFPALHDRIVEIAVIGLDGLGRTVSEYATLVNPERDVGPTHIHGICAADVVSAPRFKDIAGDVADCLSGGIIVAHNTAFDVDFLAAEFRRVGVQLPKVATLCTLELSWRASLPASSRRLSDCCAACGIPHPRCHVALEDARATASLLLALLDRLAVSRLEQLGCVGDCIRDGEFPDLSRTSLACSREVAHAIREDAQGYLARLVSKMPITAGMPGASERPQEGTLIYLEFLDRVLEDRYITAAEAQALVQLAARWGMSQSQIEEVHRRYLGQLVSVALADGVVTQSERRDLASVTERLGLAEGALDEAITATTTSSSNREAIGTGPPHRGFQGWSVCFTGDLCSKMGGLPISREEAEELAAAAGMKVLDNVSRRLDILVVADPLTQSGKAAKARIYGTRIMAEEAFWRMIGAPVD